RTEGAGADPLRRLGARRSLHRLLIADEPRSDSPCPRARTGLHARLLKGESTDGRSAPVAALVGLWLAYHEHAVDPAPPLRPRADRRGDRARMVAARRRRRSG